MNIDGKSATLNISIRVYTELASQAQHARRLRERAATNIKTGGYKRNKGKQGKYSKKKTKEKKRKIPLMNAPDAQAMKPGS